MEKCRSDIINLFSIFKTAGFFLLLLPFSLAPLISLGAVITVPGDYSTIQAAIDAAVHGDEIIVSPGVYAENIRFHGKNIILRSTDPSDPDVVYRTAINGAYAGPAVTFSGTENETCVLSGFRIFWGRSSSGGGIYGNGTKATIQYNRIVENIAYANYGIGGGVLECHGIIEYNTILNNRADRGKGGGLCDCDGIIRNNIISGNSCSGYGGGLFGCDGIIESNIISENRCTAWLGGGGGLCGCKATIRNNIIMNNTVECEGGGLNVCYAIIQSNIIFANSAGQGGGLKVCNSILENNTIISNSADKGGGLCSSNDLIINCIIANNTNYGIYESRWDSQPKEVKYCVLYGNTGGDYYDYETSSSYIGSAVNDLPEVHDCISTDPLFLNPGKGDFHLQPISPCIDAGCNVTGLTQDFEGDPRPYDGTWQPRGDGSDFDIGADEYSGFGPNPIRTLVTHFYNSLLNRAPEPVAVPAWESYFDYALDFNVAAHFIAGDIGWRIFASDEYYHRNRSREEFIRDCYRGFLLRMPSSDEVTAWLNGSWSRDEAISIFVNSNEFIYLIIGIFPDHEGDAVRNFTAYMYMGILGRLVDGGAVDAWDDLFQATSDKRGTAKWVAKVLFSSDEYTSKNPTNRYRVICMYRGLLGRFPHYGEISYWEGELNSGRRTLEELIDILCDSEEFTARLIEFFGTAGPSTTENIDHIYEEIEPSPAPSVESPVTRVPDWEYY